ncbi:hypothetical protein [Chryseobacterium echinoideorum]|uniref:hypothetical protein n=1 Tax=Chryseobacterium echinoideorum TaxID=1549648 RepID=UPI0011868FF0|nr:hypothetical protein [Chryseobacterium echinoideorum]
MKTYFFSALILGLTVISCSKEKTQVDNQTDTMTSADTSMALPLSDTATLNVQGRPDSSQMMRDSIASPNHR